jgi:hypothetical protein
MTEDTFEKVKKGIKETAEGVKDTAKDVVNPDTYTGSDDKTENRDYNESGGKEPMNPDDIAAHEPTAVKRDQDTDIAEESQTGTDSSEAREKFRKSGMTEAK